ncbi:hypothetical protein AAG906_005628 [Vitis piasezkii]
MWVHIWTFKAALVTIGFSYPLHSLILVSIFVPNLDSPPWIRIRGRLTSIRSARPKIRSERH